MIFLALALITIILPSPCNTLVLLSTSPIINYGLGIDLGTSHSCCSILPSTINPSLGSPNASPNAAFVRPKPVLVPLLSGNATVPSLITIVNPSSTKSFVHIGPIPSPPSSSTSSSTALTTYRSLKRILSRGYRWLYHPLSSGGVSSTSSEPAPRVKPNSLPSRTIKLFEQVPHIAQPPPVLRTLLINPPTTSASAKVLKEPLKLARIQEDFEADPISLTLPPSSSSSSPSSLPPTILSSYIITYLLHSAHAHLSALHPDHELVCDRIVCGVPAYFDEAQKHTTTEIVKVGLDRFNVLRANALPQLPHYPYPFLPTSPPASSSSPPKIRLIAEPEAASLAYSVLAPPSPPPSDSDAEVEDDFVLVFDLGGGTFDCSILAASRLSTRAVGTVELIASSGNANLGGNDFDYRVFEEVIVGEGLQEFARWPSHTEIPEEILVLCEGIRVYLSSHAEIFLHLPNSPDAWISLLASSSAPITLSLLMEEGPSLKSFRYTREAFEMHVSDLMLTLLRPLREIALLSDVALLGDASPRTVAAAIAQGAAQSSSRSSNAPPSSDLSDVVRDLAKLQKGARKKRRNLETSMKAYKSSKAEAGARVGASGLKDMPGKRALTSVILVGGCTKTPLVARLVESLTGVAPTYVNGMSPDHSVALGAAVQVGVYDGVYDDEGSDEGGLGVMSPFQAALLRAIAKKEGLL